MGCWSPMVEEYVYQSERFLPKSTINTYFIARVSSPLAEASVVSAEGLLGTQEPLAGPGRVSRQRAGVRGVGGCVLVFIDSVIRRRGISGAVSRKAAVSFGPCDQGGCGGDRVSFDPLTDWSLVLPMLFSVSGSNTHTFVSCA